MLSDEQISQLFAFCERKKVVHYDLQVELVDHLANAIEKKIAADPGLSFEEALGIVYEAFGVTDFADIVKERRRALEKQYRRQRRRIFFSYFTWPKAALTVCFFLALYMLVKALPGMVVYFVLWTLLVVQFLAQLFIIREAGAAVGRKEKRKLMMIQSAFTESVWQQALTGLPIGLLVHDDYFKKLPGEISPPLIILVGLMTILLLATLSFRHVIKQTVQQAKKDFPEVFSTTG
jgi:hypothetical protein